MGNWKNLPQHGKSKPSPQFKMLKHFTEKTLRRLAGQPSFVVFPGLIHNYAPPPPNNLVKDVPDDAAQADVLTAN
jgi:hypothetical protein